MMKRIQTLSLGRESESKLAETRDGDLVPHHGNFH
jgi:hypothetical protein